MIHDHHEGYISWAEFEHQHLIADNANGKSYMGVAEGLQPIQHFLGDDAIDPHPAEADAIGDGFGAERWRNPVGAER